ncbi:MAG: hypothetical protein ACQEWV_03310 [Bacillota bacterium]
MNDADEQLAEKASLEELDPMKKLSNGYKKDRIKFYSITCQKKIESINDKDERFTVVRFSLRHGMNSINLIRNECVFKQSFGNHIEIERNLDKYGFEDYICEYRVVEYHL